MGGNISAEQLMLYFNLILTALVVLGALGGYLRGFKKSLFRFIKEIIFVAGFFFTADLFSGFILNSELVFDLVVQYVPVNGAPANMIELVQCFMVDYLGVSPDATLTSSIHFVFAIASIALKLAYAIVYFILIRILYSIVCSIIYKCIINRKHTETFLKLKKRKNGKIKKIKETVDLRKGSQGPRLLGALFGAGKSMITVTMLVSLIMSLVSLLPDNLSSITDGESKVTASNKVTLSAENKDMLSDTLQGLEEYIKFIDDLENSPYVKLIRTINNDEETLDLVLFDTVFNANYEEYNIRTRESLSLMVNIGFDVYTIMNESINDEGYLDLNNVDVEHLAELIEKITDIDLLMEAIPVVVELGLSMETLETQLPIPLDDGLKEVLVEIDWKNDVMVLADVVRTLGDIDDLNYTFQKPAELLSKNNEKVIKEIITKLSDMTLVTKMLPAAVEYAMDQEEVKALIGDATVDLSNIVWEEELVKVSEIYSVFHTLSQDVTSLLFVDEINVGDVIDGVNLNALNNLILKVFELGLMEELFEPIMNLVVANIEDEAIREMLNFDMDNYDDWAKEFTIIIDIVKELLADGNPFENGIDVNIIKNVNPKTLSKSRILSKVLVSALVDASNGEGIFAGDGSQELSEFIDVPSSLKNKESPIWYDVYDEDGLLISKGELHKTLEALQSILPETKETKMNVNDTITLSYTLSGATNANVVFSSTNETVATVNEQGVVEALAPGHTTIIATTSNGLVKDMVDVIVKSDVTVPVEYVYIEGSTSYNITIGIGQENRVFLSANTNLDASNQIIVWESLDDEVVKVSADGAIQGLQIGTAIVKATSNADPSKFAICTVTVVDNLPSEIKVNKEALVGHVDKVFYLDASIDGSKEGLTYKVVNDSIASVDEEGFVKLLNTGETTLVVYNENKTITKTVKILVLEEGLPTSIKLQTLSEGFDVSSILSSLDQNDVDTIVESDVLTRSLSKILLNALGDDGSETSVHIPLSVMIKDQETYYISKEELKTVLEILLKVDLTSVLYSGDVPSLLEDLEDDDIDAILKSKVLGAFLSSTISSVGDGMIVVPSSAYKDMEVDSCYKHPSHEIKYLKNSEVKALVKLLKDYDLLSGGNISIPLSEDNSELIDLIESSSILRATLSKFVLDMSQGSEAIIVVPDQALDTVDGVKMLKSNEFEAVLDALYDLGIEEISQDLTLELNVGDLTNASESVNKSLVLRATITNFVTPIEQIVVPDQALDRNYTVNNSSISVLKKTELTNLFNSLGQILGEDASFDDFSLDMNLGKIKTLLPDIQSSLILKATISSIIGDVEQVLVPDQATDNTTYSVDEEKIRVLYDEELESLINTLVSLLGEDASVETIELDLTVGALKDSLNDIKQSKILMATLSDVITKLEEITIPDQAIDNSYTVNNESIDVLYKEELDGLVNTLVSLLGEDASVETIELDLTVGALKNSLNDIKQSKILMATISKFIVDVEEIIVPDQVLDDSYTLNNEEIDVLTTIELDGLVNTLVTLLGEDATVESVSLNLTIGELQDSLDDIKSSKVLMSTLSDVIVKLEEIIVPDQALDKVTYTVNATPISVLHDDELDGLINTLASFMDENEKVDHIELEISTGTLHNSIDDIKQSKILMATLSDIIVDLEEIIVPDQVLNNSYTLNSETIKVLYDEELDSLVEALVVLLGEEAAVGNISLDLTIGELQDSLDDIKSSKVLMSSLSKVIVELDAIIVPDQALDKVNYTVDNTSISVLYDDELDGLINTLASFIDENEKVDHIELEISTGKLQSSLNDIKHSKILMATISDMIVPLDAIIVPDQVLDNSYTLNNEIIKVLTTTELEVLTEALIVLLGSESDLLHIELDLTVSKLNEATGLINESGILRTTVGDMIIPLTSIIIPDEVVIDDLYSKGSTYYPVLEEDELIALFASLNALTGPSKVENIDLNLTVGKLNASVNILKQSCILRATITDKLDDVSALTKPDQSFEVEGTFKKDGNSIKVVKEEELVAFTTALANLLGAETKLNNELSMNISVNKLKSAVNPINASVILKSTIGEKIINNENLLVPDQAIDGTTYSIGATKVKVLKDNELQNLVNALEALLGPSTTIEDVALDLTVSTLKGAITHINNSLIIRSTISDKINEVTALKIVNEAYEAKETFTKDSVNLDVLKGSELKGLIDSLVALLGENTKINGSLSLSITVSKLYDSVDDINSSLVLRSTITDKIKASLVVPSDALDNQIYHIGDNETRILSINELESLAKALVNILGGNQGLDSFEIPTNFVTNLLLDSDEPNKNKLEQSLESVIIWDKISTMIDEVTGSLIEIPNNARVDNDPENRITVEEINNLIEALDVLGISDINNISLSADFIMTLDDETKDVLGNTELTRTTIALEKSKILMASIPTLFESGIRGAYEEAITLDFGTIELKGELNDEGTAYVNEGELVRLFRAVRAANTLKSKTLSDITGKISDSNSSVSFINKQFLILNDSEVLKPTVKQVLVQVIGSTVPLVGDEFDDETITLVLSKTAAIQDLNKIKNDKGINESVFEIYSGIILVSATVDKVEENYDKAVIAFDAL